MKVIEKYWTIMQSIQDLSNSLHGDHISVTLLYENIIIIIL